MCNALDTILVHQSVANELIPAVARRLAQDGVSFRADPRALPLVQNLAGVNASAAGAEDFDTEWLSLVLGIKVVNSLEEAIQHISEHSTGHSDGILTRNQGHASAFITAVELGSSLRERIDPLY